MNNANLAPIFREAARMIAEHECTYVGQALQGLNPRKFARADTALARIFGIAPFGHGAEARDERVMYLLLAANWCESEDA